jgi:hypothetical protein
MAEDNSIYADLLNLIPNPPDTCHICSSRDNVVLYKFGLAKKLKVTRNWRNSTISLGALIFGIVTTPILPILSIFLGPIIRSELGANKTTTYATLIMHLQVCPLCKQRKGSKWGNLPFGMKHYKLHPHWKLAHKLGFREFFPPWRV